ncbi:MAG TPA: PRC-barrel domain-containing protein [Alphaproteobacteria bacterium]
MNKRGDTSMNKKWKLLPAACVAVATVVAFEPLPAFTQAGVQLVVVDVAAVGKGYRASKLRNTAVYNDRNERIGTIDDIIIGRDKVLFAVLDVGGFLGIGGRKVAVPYQSLNLDGPDGKVILPGASKDELKRLPEFQYT